MKLYLAFAKCADCNTQIQVHAYGIDATNTALTEAVHDHLRAFHYEGEPVAFQMTGVAVQGAA